MFEKLIFACGATAALLWLGVASWRDRRRARVRQAPRTLDTTALARSCHCDVELAALRAQIAHADAAVRRAEDLEVLLRAACEAHGLNLGKEATAREMLQALRTAGVTNQAAIGRLQVATSVYQEALAAVAALHLSAEVAPGQYTPQDVVSLVARARTRGSA